MAYTNIDKCGLYQDHCCYLLRKMQSDKTWGNFKAHFDRSFEERRRSSRTSITKWYLAHMHAAQANTELLTKIQQDHTLVLANLATATQADRTSVALLTNTISELSGQVVLLTAKLATEQAENARVKKLGPQSTTARHGNQESRNKTLSEPNPSQDRNLYS